MIDVVNGFFSHVASSTCLAAVEYVTILATSHGILRQRLKDLDAVKIVKDSEVLIYQRGAAEWDTLLDSGRQALVALSCNCSIWRLDGRVNLIRESTEDQETQEVLQRLIFNAR